MAVHFYCILAFHGILHAHLKIMNFQGSEFR